MQMKAIGPSSPRIIINLPFILTIHWPHDTTLVWGESNGPVQFLLGVKLLVYLPSIYM